MVKHIIIWKLKDEYSASQKSKYMEKIKKDLEALSGKIPGLVEIKVQTTSLPSSSGDLMLDTTFLSEEALKDYQKNPDHLSVATFVRSVVGSRLSLDYEI